MEVAGKPVPLQVWWKPLRDAGDRLTGVITVFSDISEKKRTEAELKRYQSELEVLIRERTQDLMEANSALVAKQRVADTLSEAATLLAAGPGLAPMLNRILELLGRVIAYKGAAILLEEDGEIKIVGAAGSSLTHLGQGISKMSGDPRARVYREGQRLVLEQGAAPDTAMEGGEETLGCRWIGLPLTADNRTFGVLALDSDESCAYEPSELTLLDAFAAQASAAVWIAQLYAQAQANAASAERERLARDLHDAVTQTLFSASIFTDMLPLQLEQEPEQVPRNLEKLGLLIRSALAEMRTLLMELRPTALIAVDLHQLIGNLINAARARTWAEFTYLVEGDSLGPLAPETQIATYRIAQELLNNVVKHSGATACEIVFTYLPEGIELTITDNGRGFDPHNVGLEHMGLAIMGERAKAIGGQLTVESKPRGGTRAMFCWRQRRESGRE